MGTSQSSKGPGSGVSLVPPWAEDIPTSDVPGDDQAAPTDDRPAPEVGFAPPRRFASARRDLGRFAASGDAKTMRAGVGAYVSTGYGGSKTFARRMAGTAHSAGNLGRVLDPSAPDTTFDRTLLAGKDANEIMDAVVEAARPHDGTQDAESSREAVRDALTEVLDRFPDANLLDLTTDEREFAIEMFVVNDVFRRFQLDVGNQILEKAPNPGLGLRRLREVKEYMTEVVAASFRKLKAEGAGLGADSIKRTVRAALTETCRVFEEYTE